MEEKITLKVAEAFQDDVNKGIVRIDSTHMQRAGIRPGDIVEIVGERKTVAIADRAYPSDIGQEIIRMDGLIRRNASTSIGELIAVRRADVKEAKKVTIAPARKGLVVRAAPEIFKHGLLGRAVVKTDIVSLGGSRRRRTSLSHSPFEEIFKMLDDDLSGFGFGDLKFIVADTNPKGPVIITAETEIVFNPEAIEVSEEKSFDISYEDIGGLSDEIRKIREMVELPLKHPEIFEALGIEPPKGVLLHGPPGTGKTLLAKAVANETNSHFIVINGPEIMSKYYGQSEQNLRKKFEEAEQNAPSIIFIDEIDAIATKREETHGEVEKRVVAQMLAIMDGLKSRGKVVVIAATNIPNQLDPALRRPGRFDREIEIGPPSKEGRLDIIKIHTRYMPLEGRMSEEILEQEAKAVIDARIASIDGDIATQEDAIASRLNEAEGARKNISILKQRTEVLENEIDQHRADLIKLEQTRTGEPEVQDQVIERIRFKKSQIAECQGKIEDSLLKRKHAEQDVVSADATLVQAKQALAGFVQAKESLAEMTNMRDIVRSLREYERLKSSDPIKELESAITRQGVDSILRKAKQEGVAKDLEKIAMITHGFVGADLSSLAKEAAMIVIRRELPNFTMNEEEPISAEILERLRVRYDDFLEALKTVRPSAMREVLIEVPNVKWVDVAALGYAREELIEAVEWPLKYPAAFDNMGITPPKGILLYGPSGTGKTLLAKAVANESEANFISVKGPELLSKWVGESEKAVREIFKKARQNAPTIVFFDEFDAIAPKRGGSNDSNVTERVVNQLLTEIDGLEKMTNVVIIAASNRPDMIDSSLLRPGRFDRLIHVKVPDAAGRFDILKVHTRNVPIEYDVDVDFFEIEGVKAVSMRDKFLSSIAKRTEGFTGADIENLVKEAAIFALRTHFSDKKLSVEQTRDLKVQLSDFEEALKKVQPSVTKEIEETYAQISATLRSARGNEAKASYFG